MRLVVGVLTVLWMIGVAAAASPRQKVQEPAMDPAVAAALMDEGAALFGSDCAACHAAEGGEGVGPSMTGNAALASKDHVIRQILDGMPAKGMPPFAPTYTDRKIAAVSTFIRGSFENAYPPVTEADVARVRAESTKK